MSYKSPIIFYWTARKISGAEVSICIFRNSRRSVAGGIPAGKISGIGNFVSLTAEGLFSGFPSLLHVSLAHIPKEMKRL
jgi:hypothetical protein